MITQKAAIIILMSLLIGGNYARAQNDYKNLPFETSVRKLAGDFKFTEGPAADKDGNIYFTDIPNNRIHIWSHDGKLSTFMENSDHANGLAFDKDGNLIACVHESGKLVSITPDGKITVLAETYQDKRFNSPNDLWIDPKGGIYFSDPRYGNRKNLPQNGEHVYYLSPDRKKVIRVIDDMVRPNGLIGTPDGKKLYVADHGADQTYLYKIKADGTLADKTLFAKQGSDGVTLDTFGNLYLTGQAVNIYSPTGEMIQIIDIPERPSNLCFGKNYKTLFITAQTSLYSIDMHRDIYLFTMTDIDGNPVPLSQYQGKVLLLVNVASKCGFTPQYAGLQQLYEKYQDQGFVVLGFPANNFLGQEPGANAQIKDFCTTKFHVTFPMFAKISVKGDDIHPLYQHLTDAQENGPFDGPITWNFNKFLIARDGSTLARFGSKATPLSPEITAAIEKALAAGTKP